jgi:hypothetical protein
MVFQVNCSGYPVNFPMVAKLFPYLQKLVSVHVLNTSLPMLWLQDYIEDIIIVKWDGEMAQRHISVSFSTSADWQLCLVWRLAMTMV